MNNETFIDEYDKIQCRVCGKLYQQISYSHLKFHKITTIEYKEMYPNAPLVSSMVVKKVSDVKKGKPAHNKGKPASEEQKRKLSIAMSGKTRPKRGPTPQHVKDKISKSLTGYKATDETRANLSASIAKRKINGTFKSPMPKGSRHTVETKRKISKALKKYMKKFSADREQILKKYVEKNNFKVLGIDNKIWTVLCTRCNIQMTCNKSRLRKRNDGPKACRTCYPRDGRVSHEEKELREHIQNVYVGKIEYNNTKILNGFEIDIFLPEINIGLEYNGLYWHSCNNPQLYFNDQRIRHDHHLIQKTSIAYSKGITLIQIYSDEWKLHKDECISKIRNLINDPSLKCSKQLTVINDNHIVDQNKLIGKIEIINGELHLSEFDLEYNRKKIIAQILPKILSNYNTVRFTSDNRWFDVLMYGLRDLNFQMIERTPPNLYAIEKFYTSRRLIVDETITPEILKESNIDSIYDCGFTIWEWTK